MTSLYLKSEYVVVDCGADGCDQRFAMSRRFYDETHREGLGWTCPRGHERVWLGESTETKLKQARAAETALRDQLAAAIREGEETRVALLRDRQRFANGVCPCCNRSFENVRRHMSTQHPDYDVAKVKPTAYRCSCGSSFRTLHGLRMHQGRSRRDGWDQPKTSRWAAHLTKA